MMTTSRAPRTAGRSESLSSEDRIDCEAFALLLKEANRGVGRSSHSRLSLARLQDWTGVQRNTWWKYSNAMRPIKLEHKLLIVRVWNQHVVQAPRTKLTPQDIFPSWPWPDLTPPPETAGAQTKLLLSGHSGTDRRMLAELLGHWEIMSRDARTRLLRRLRKEPAAEVRKKTA